MKKQRIWHRIAIEFVRTEEVAVQVGRPAMPAALTEIDFTPAPARSGRRIFPSSAFDKQPTAKPEGDDLKGHQGQTFRF